MVLWKGDNWRHSEDYGKERPRVVGEMQAREAREPTNTIKWKKKTHKNCKCLRVKDNSVNKKDTESWWDKKDGDGREVGHANWPNSQCASSGQNWHCNHICPVTTVWLRKTNGAYRETVKRKRGEERHGGKNQSVTSWRKRRTGKGKKSDIPGWIISRNLLTETNNLLSLLVLKSFKWHPVPDPCIWNTY